MCAPSVSCATRSPLPGEGLQMNAGNPGVFSHRESDVVIVLNNFTIQLVPLTRDPAPANFVCLGRETSRGLRVTVSNRVCMSSSFAFLWMFMYMLVTGMIGFPTALVSTAILAAGLSMLVTPSGIEEI